LPAALSLIFFLLLDQESAALTHHLPLGIENNCISISATAAGCRQVEAKTTSKHTNKGE
jgi:hypothetical protein